MELSQVDSIQKRTITALEKKHIYTTRDMLLNIPRVYYDFRETRTLREAAVSGKVSAIRAVIDKCKKSYSSNNRTVLTAKGKCMEDGVFFSVIWIGQPFMEKQIETYMGKEAIICGVVKYDTVYGYTMNNPMDYRLNTVFSPKIVPVYPKYKGLSEEMRIKIVKELLDYHTQEILPEELIKQHSLISYEQMIKGFHCPADEKDYALSKRRLIYEEMLYFAAKLRESDKRSDNITNYAIHRNSLTKKVIKALPYTLTESQENALKGMLADINSGKKLNVLLNGDVGSGKSIVIFLMMLLAAENDYQAVLMVPTTILASQHYQELKGYAELCGLEVAFLNNKLKGKARAKILERIKDGSIKLIVGTHSVIVDKVEYKNTALVITDEEHRFGTGQRDLLQQKAGQDSNVISVSATPIPRTLASVLYQNKKVLYLYPPENKGKIQTAVVQNPDTALKFAEGQIAQGRQCYAVCPLIEITENSPEGVVSVESVYASYQEYFQNKSVRIACITGKMKPEESLRIINDYRDGRIDILIATTVIEVGVSVANASVMIIHNAERFGLFQLHQLRGRIGRGQYKGYCILISAEKGANNRLEVMEREVDGFRIAEADLLERGSGDLLGTEQSGFNKYVELMVKNKETYEIAKADVEWCEKNGICLDSFLKEHGC